MAYRSKPLHMLEASFHTPEITSVMDSFNKLWLSKQKLPEGCQLYHYTTLSGMQGILKERTLWCSHSGTLNDPLEIQYGQKLVANVLLEFMEKEKRDALRVFLRHLLVNVQAFGKVLYHTFVACFCESDNLLSQWRGYADKGGGYCIGIEFSSSTRFSFDMKNLGKENSPCLRKVIYNKKEQQELVRRYVREVTKAAETALDRGIAAQYADTPKFSELVMATQASNVLLDILHSFKHPAFESEEEWRLVYVAMEIHQPEKLRFRENSSGLVPYREMHIYDLSDDKKPEFPLRSIVFGPMLDPMRTRSAIKLLLHHISADNHAIILTPHNVQIKGPGYSLRQ